VPFEIDPAGLESITVKVSIKELECKLDNNEVVLRGPFCGWAPHSDAAVMARREHDEHVMRG